MGERSKTWLGLADTELKVVLRIQENLEKKVKLEII